MPVFAVASWLGWAVIGSGLLVILFADDDFGGFDRPVVKVVMVIIGVCLIVSDITAVENSH